MCVADVPSIAMSSLDPSVASPRSNARSLTIAYKRLAALAAGLPLPAGGGNGGGGGGKGKVVLSIQVQKGAKPGERIVLDIGRSSSRPTDRPKNDTKPKPPPSEKKAQAAPKPAASSEKPRAAAGSVSVGKVPADEPAKLDASEIARCQVPQEVSPTQARVSAEATKMGLSTSYFYRVRSDYYEQELAWRRDVLGAASVTQLCKSMIMENTKLSDLTHQQAVEGGRVKYVCVVLQYAGAKLQKEKLTDAIRKMEGSKAVGKKQYSLRMVSMETSDQLSGYTHNVRTSCAPLEPL